VFNCQAVRELLLRGCRIRFTHWMDLGLSCRPSQTRYTPKGNTALPVCTFEIRPIKSLSREMLGFLDAPPSGLGTGTGEQMLPGRCTAGGWSWGFWSPEPWAAAWSGVPRLFPTAGCRGGRRMHHQCVRGVWTERMGVPLGLLYCA
jgi:hypothetical protein